MQHKKKKKILDGKNHPQYLKMNFLVFARVGSITQFGKCLFQKPWILSFAKISLKCTTLIRSDHLSAVPFSAEKTPKMPRHPVSYVDFLSTKGSVEWS